MTKGEVLERLRGHCLRLEGAEEEAKWGDDVVFQVGKMLRCWGVAGDLCLTEGGKEAMGVFLRTRGILRHRTWEHGWVALRLGAEMEEEEVANWSGEL